MKNKHPTNEQADADYGGEYHKYLKHATRRKNRRHFKRLVHEGRYEDISEVFEKRYAGYES